jgi:hypothetical protein
MVRVTCVGMRFVSDKHLGLRNGYYAAAVSCVICACVLWKLSEQFLKTCA